MCMCESKSLFFFFNDTATTEIYTLSLHDALPISVRSVRLRPHWRHRGPQVHVPDYAERHGSGDGDRKSTRLNSSHLVISYAVFCLKKKTRNRQQLSAEVGAKKLLISRSRSSLESS